MKDVHELQSRRLNFILELLLEKTKEFADINRNQPLEWSIMHMYSCSQLGIIKNGIKLNAIRDAHVEYVNEYSFLVDADPEGTVVQYEKGLLIVNVPMIGKDPFKNVKPIEIK
jgi:hypothetical protein